MASDFIHTHILPKNLPNLREKFGTEGYIRLEYSDDGETADMWQDDKFFRAIEKNCYCPMARVPDMERTDVNVQVLSTVPVMFSYWARPEDCLELCKIINDDIAENVKMAPDKFIGLGTLPMQAPELAIQELRRCKLELGLAGVQIGTHINDWNLDAPELFPIFEEAERIGASIFVHPWDMMSKEKMEDYWLPWLVGMPAETSLAICSLIFGGVFERLPNLKFCFAHAGGSFPGTIARVQHGFDVRPDLCAIRNKKGPREYCGKFYVDSLTHCPDMLQQVVKLFGADKIILGSDYPFPLGEHVPGKLVEEVEFLSDEEKRKILGLNCLEFFGLDPADYIK